jgi:two-component system, NtrC family, sensor kinase
MNLSLKLTIVLLLFALSGGFAQNKLSIKHMVETSNATVFQLSLSGEKSVAPDKFWKYKQGDNPDWAQPDFADQDWPVLNLNRPAYQNPQLSSGEMGWLRLRFAVDSTLQKKLLALIISQYGATEIYLDGRRIQQYGIISPAGQIQLYNPHNAPIPLRLGDQETHLLAIRCAFPGPAANWIYQQATISPISVRFQLLGAALTDWEIILKQNRTTIGIAFLTGAFCLFFLLLYVFYPEQKLNFFFGLFNFIYNLNLILFVFQTEGHYGLNEYVLITFFRDFMSRVVWLSVLAFIVMALYNRIPRPYIWFILFIIFIDIPLNIILLPTGTLLFYRNLVRIFFLLFFIWLAVDAFRSKNREDWLVGLIAITSALIHSGFLLQNITGIDIGYLSDISDPIVIFPFVIIYLALRYAQTNTSLEHQLIKAEELSERKLQQEQEKQQLLAKQNEILVKQMQARTTEGDRQN